MAASEPIMAFTVTGNDFSTGEGVSPTIRAGADRQNTTPMVVVPVQDGRGMEKAQNGLGVGEPGDPMYTLDCTGAQAVAYEVPAAEWWNGNPVADALTVTSDSQRMPDKGRLQMVVQRVDIPCQVDGSPVSSTLRGFGHGWQGQHNSTNAVVQDVNEERAVFTAYSIREDAKANNFHATPTDTALCVNALQPSPQSHHAQIFIVQEER